MLVCPSFPRAYTSNLKVRSSSLPWARQGRAVALSGSFPAHNLRQQRALEAMTVAAAAEVEVEVD